LDARRPGTVGESPSIEAEHVRSGYDFGYDNRVKACPLVPGRVRSNGKPPQDTTLTGASDSRCPQ